MGAHDSVGTGYRPPSSKHLKTSAGVKTEVHAMLDTVGRLLLFGVNTVRSSFCTLLYSSHLLCID
jgi:hypothetical protein